MGEEEGVRVPPTPPAPLSTVPDGVPEGVVEGLSLLGEGEGEGETVEVALRLGLREGEEHEVELDVMRGLGEGSGELLLLAVREGIAGVGLEDAVGRFSEALWDWEEERDLLGLLEELLL
jgi:hypothetical protein